MTWIFRKTEFSLLLIILVEALYRISLFSDLIHGGILKKKDRTQLQGLRQELATYNTYVWNFFIKNYTIDDVFRKFPDVVTSCT